MLFSLDPDLPLMGVSTGFSYSPSGFGFIVSSSQNPGIFCLRSIRNTYSTLLSFLCPLCFTFQYTVQNSLNACIKSSLLHWPDWNSFANVLPEIKILSGTYDTLDHLPIFLEVFCSPGELNCSLYVLRTLSRYLLNLSTMWCEAEITVPLCLINLSYACWSLCASANDSDIGPTLQSDFSSENVFRILTEPHKLSMSLEVLCWGLLWFCVEMSV